MQKNKVLITGSSGLLGTKLVKLINPLYKYEIINYDIPNNIYDYICDKYFEMDFIKTVENNKPNFIINAAAMTNVDQCEIRKEECYISNFLLVKKIVDLCMENNIYLIHISTNFIFDGKQGYYTEDNQDYNPINYYGYTKLQAEKYIIDSLANYNILRTILLYDYFGKEKCSSFIEKIIFKLKNKEKVYAVSDEFSNPTLVDDLGKSCILCMDKKNKGIFNIGGGDYMSIYQIAIKIADIYGFSNEYVIPIKSKDVKNRVANRPCDATLSINKAREVLDYSPLNFEKVFV